MFSQCILVRRKRWDFTLGISSGMCTHRISQEADNSSGGIIEVFVTKLSRTFFTFSNSLLCPEINLINQMCLDTAVFSHLSPWCLYLLNNSAVASALVPFIKQERILTHNLLGPKSHSTEGKSLFHLMSLVHQNVSLVFNKYMLTYSAFQHVQIYNPSFDDFWSVLHILSDPSAHVTFAVWSSLSH